MRVSPSEPLHEFGRLGAYPEWSGNMTTDAFAEKHRRTKRRDECGPTIIPGRPYRSHIYEHSDSELGAVFVTSGKLPPRTLFWRKRRRECLTAGMILRQEGDAEGAFQLRSRETGAGPAGPQAGGCPSQETAISRAGRAAGCDPRKMPLPSQGARPRRELEAGDEGRDGENSSLGAKRRKGCTSNAVCVRGFCKPGRDWMTRH